MALDVPALLERIEMLRTADGGELMRRLLGGMLQAVVDAGATAHIGADRHERSDVRTTQRKGTGARHDRCGGPDGQDRRRSVPGRSSRRCSPRAAGSRWRTTRL